MPLAMGTQMNPPEEDKSKQDSGQSEPLSSKQKRKSRIVIKDSGVYKFERNDRERVSTSAVGQNDFNPKDFLQARARR